MAQEAGYIPGLVIVSMTTTMTHSKITVKHKTILILNSPSCPSPDDDRWTTSCPFKFSKQLSWLIDEQSEARNGLNADELNY